MKAGKFLKYLVLTVVAINVMIIAAMFLGSAGEAKPVPMPNPNGYDDFVKAGKGLIGSDISYTNRTREELLRIALTNSEALRLFREGLTRECVVPQDYSASIGKGGIADSDEHTALKSLVFFVCAEGKLLEMDAQTNDAVQIYLDSVRFAVSCGRGGVLSDKLVSIKCEAITMQSLQLLTPTLNAKQCAEVVRALEQVDLGSDSVETICAREKAFSRKVGGLRGQLLELVLYKQTKAANQRAVDRIQANTLRRRQAMISFAARAYELDKGKPPASVADLTPAYLKAIPQDPVTKTNLAFVP